MACLRLCLRTQLKILLKCREVKLHWSSNRKDAREKQIQSERNGFIFAGAVVFFIVVFAYAALQIGKDAVILDMVKVLIGFAGGYGIGRAAQSRKDRKEEKEDSDD
jgi:hypothetical protein